MPDIMTAPTSLTPRRFSVHEYYDMVRTGILGADERVELLDGQVVRMTPMGSRHAACVSVLNRLLVVEVSESSLQRDRGVKLAMYAEAGVPEVWIVDIPGRHLEVFRALEADRYTAVARPTFAR